MTAKETDTPQGTKGCWRVACRGCCLPEREIVTEGLYLIIRGRIHPAFSKLVADVVRRGIVPRATMKPFIFDIL